MVTRPTQDADTNSAFFCDDGEVHDWTYLRDDKMTYRCKRCVATIQKSRLKELTDNA